MVEHEPAIAPVRPRRRSIAVRAQLHHAFVREGSVVGVEREHEDVLGGEASLDVLQIPLRAHEEPCREDEDEAQGDLRGDEHLTAGRAANANRAGTSCSFSARARSSRVALKAGIRPKTTPVSSDSSIVNRNTTRSGCASMTIGF